NRLHVKMVAQRQEARLHAHAFELEVVLKVDVNELLEVWTIVTDMIERLLAYERGVVHRAEQLIRHSCKQRVATLLVGTIDVVSTVVFNQRLPFDLTMLGDHFGCVFPIVHVFVAKFALNIGPWKDTIRLKDNDRWN